MASPLRGIPAELRTFSGRDVNNGRYFKAVTQIGQKVLFQTFMLLYITFVSTSGTMPLYDYLTQHCHCSNTKMKDNFNYKEIEIIKKDPRTYDSECDVTLLWKMIMAAFGESRITDALTKQIRELKSLRNEACHHGYVIVDDVDLQNRMKLLSCLSEEILDEASRISGVNVSGFITDVKDSLKQLTRS